MYHLTSPTTLYREYEARAAAAVRKHAYMVEAQDSHTLVQASDSRQDTWAQFSAWWRRERMRIVAYLQPAEPEGYIA